MGRRSVAKARGGKGLLYDYPKDMDAEGRRKFRQRINAKAKRDAKRASLTSGE